MGLIVLLILFGTPIVEIYVMIEIGDEIGALNTVALILLTAGLGGLLFRVQGLSTLRRVQEHLDQGEMPVGDLLSGLGILLAALLLFIPGFVTDAIGFLLFIPPLRRALMALLVARAMARGVVFTSMRRPGGGPGGDMGPGGPRPRTGPGGPVIDGDYEDRTESDGERLSDPDRGPDRDPDQRPGG